jgi:tetratricopeptide (TPR) repeat protein
MLRSSVLFGLFVLGLPVAFVDAVQSDDDSLMGDYSREEILLLPRYCWASNSINKSLGEPVLSEQERTLWYNNMGQTFNHIHHWCWGLMQLRRGNLTANASKRRAHYRAAISNFDYVLRHANSQFPLKPEFHLRKGMALRLMGEDGDAAQEFSNAINLKPDYAPAYSALIDLHVDLGNLAEAMSLVEIGLGHAPSSEILAQKKLELESLSHERN